VETLRRTRSTPTHSNAGCGKNSNPRKAVSSMRNITAAIATVCMALVVGAAAQQASPDVILTNGKIFTSNAAQPYVQAVAIRGERIAGVGTAAQVEPLANHKTRIIDLGGRTVIPGIHDAHNHLFIAPQNRVELHFKSFDPSWSDAKQDIAAALEKAPKGAFIYGDIGPAIFHDVSVDRKALDNLSVEHPIILTTFTGHGAIVNSAALKAAGIDESQPDPFGGNTNASPTGS
jgi:predicted amidohydrolase YtcJ